MMLTILPESFFSEQIAMRLHGGFSSHCNDLQNFYLTYLLVDFRFRFFFFNECIKYNMSNKSKPLVCQFINIIDIFHIYNIQLDNQVFHICISILDFVSLLCKP